MTAARRYLESHAVDLSLAAELGVYGMGDSLVFPYPGEDGESMFERRKVLGGKIFQPPNQSLALYWPMGREGVDVVLTEGETDTLAACSALNDDPEYWEGCAVAGLPGTGMNTDKIVEELKDYQRVYIVMDSDGPGRKKRDSLYPALVEAGIRAVPVDLAEGCDLSDELVVIPRRMRSKWLADYLRYSEQDVRCAA